MTVAGLGDGLGDAQRPHRKKRGVRNCDVHGPRLRCLTKRGNSKSGLTAVWGLGCVLVLLIIIGIASFLVLAYRDLEETQQEGEEGRSDVQIARCDVDADGVPRVEVEVTNSSSETSDYQVEIEFDSPTDEGFVAEGLVFIDDVPPGRMVSRSEEAPARERVTDEVVRTAPDDVTYWVESAERAASVRTPD